LTVSHVLILEFDRFDRKQEGRQGVVRMWFPEIKINTAIQSKGKCDSDVADGEDNNIFLKPCYSFVGTRLSVSNLKSLQDTLRLLFESSEFTNALILPVKYFGLFGNFN
jgi:hypothetical protein